MERLRVTGWTSSYIFAVGSPDTDAIYLSIYYCMDSSSLPCRGFLYSSSLLFEPSIHYSDLPTPAPERSS